MNFTNGERGLIRRALRYYINGERAAVHAVVCTSLRKGETKAKREAHIADVKQQAEAHIAAAEALLTKLLPHSTERNDA